MYQVCEAGLHICLGVGLRQFKLLEHQLQLLDLEIAICRAEAVMSSSEEELHHLLKDAQALESESEDLVQEADHHQEVHDWYRASGDPDDEPGCAFGCPALASFGKLFRAFTRQPRPK